MASGTRRRIPTTLIIDDETLAAVALAGLLSDEFAVTLLAEPAVALERLAMGARFDVVLCDLDMPSMNGVELLERVRQVAPECADRFVFMAGEIRDPGLRARIERLPNLILEKPLDIEAVRALVLRRAGVPEWLAHGSGVA